MTLNGTPQTLPSEIETIDDLVRYLNLHNNRISILHNNHIVTDRFTTIAPNDCLEILHFVGGGSPNH